MKKIKNLLLCSFFCCTILFGINSVCAEDYSISVDATTGNAGASLQMKLNGITDTNSDYFVLFVNEGESKPDVSVCPSVSSIGVDQYNIRSFKGVSTTTGDISIQDDWYMLKGYDYAYIVKCPTTTTCKVTENAIKVERPSLSKLSSRYQIFLFGDGKGLSAYPYFPNMGKNGDHKLVVKVGLISNNEILNKLAKNESDSLSSLMTYAKNDNSGTEFSATDDEMTSSKGVDISSFKVSNGSYYYIYTTYTDDSYRDLSDIAIAMGERDILTNDVKWNITDNTNKTSVIKNPKTGVYYVTGILSILLVLGSVLFISIRKRSKFPQVK